MVCFKRNHSLALVFAGVLTLAARAGAQEGVPAGKWQGPWYLGMTSGHAELTLSQGDASGTLLMTNHETFGDSPVALREVVVEEGKLRFRAKAADGQLVEAILPIVGGSDKLKGPMRYGGYKYLLDLVRAKP